MTNHLETTLFKKMASELGFSLSGVCRAEINNITANRFMKWLADNYDGEMAWLRNRAEEKINPSLYMNNAQSVLVVAKFYNPKPAGKNINIASYIRGDDYHDILKSKLHELAANLSITYNQEYTYRVCVDTSPLLEREFARNAGIGWQGKNTMIINQKLGSYFFLGEIITDQTASEYDAPIDDRCGTCTKCLDACPPQAFTAPYVLNSTLCTSYQTIEKRGPLDENSNPENWLYGCDICQQVCPWNKSPNQFLNEILFSGQHPLDEMTLQDILELTDETFKILFKNSAAKRLKRKGFIRNALTLWQLNPTLAPAETINQLRNDSNEEIKTYAESAWQNIFSNLK
jgi:epoxyqueuosine reductase